LFYASEGRPTQGGAPMDYLKDLERKLGRYLAMPDCPATWAEIYKDGGMDLIGEYSKRLDPEGADEKAYEHKVIERYWVGAGQAAESEEEILGAINKMPERYRPRILSNPHCTERIIETLWVGSYVNDDGSPFPEFAAVIAFFMHNKKALAIFARRKDLRDLPEYLVNLFLSGCARDGLVVDDGLRIDTAQGYGRLN
jgi:hypothetical protein